MSNNHFNFFRVKNFKRFKDLEVKDIGQFNLVLGDNNVGKTSLLEALMYEENLDIFMLSLLKRIEKRNIGSNLSGGVWELFVNSDSMLLDDQILTEFQTNDNEPLSLLFDKITKELSLWNGAAILNEFLNEKFNRSDWKVSNPNSLQWPADYFEPLICNLQGHDFLLTKQYSKLVQTQNKTVKDGLIKSLQIIDPDVKSLEIQNITTDVPLLTIESEKNQARNLLAFYGDGLISVYRIILFLMLFKNKKLMIDEIDAGIHYSRMKDYWKVILQSAIENEVQLFATTHNRECIQYYMEALEELGDEYKEKARSIRLVEHAQTKEIISFTSLISEMKEDFAVGNEVR